MPSVRDIIDKKDRKVVTVSENDSVWAAAKAMAADRIGSAVVQAGEKVIGIFTERDLLNRVVAQNRDPAQVRVGEVMSSPVAYCRLETKLAECKSLMAEKKLRHLPVMEEGQLIGIISIGDINAREAVDQAHTIEYLQEYIHGRT